eukprot:COSAG01_NODE_8646_length_2709_cov_4.027586_2_plen_252_part_00
MAAVPWIRRLQLASTHLGGSSSAAPELTFQKDPPLGSLRQPHSLHTWTVQQLLPPQPAAPPPPGRHRCDGLGAATGGAATVEPAEFPPALPDSHAAVAQFRELGYVVVQGAILAGALERAQRTFRARQPFARLARAEQRRRTPDPRPGHPSAELSQRYYDLPREDMALHDSGSCNGSHGGFLVTRSASDFDAFVGVLANANVLPLLLALCGPAMHLLEVGARTVDAVSAATAVDRQLEKEDTRRGGVGWRG